MTYTSAYCECCEKLLERLTACPFMSCSILLLAALVPLCLIFRLIRNTYCCIEGCIRAKNLKKYGEWAVITGASDGIGKAMALELVKKGFNKFILIARNDAKLKDTATELELVSVQPVSVVRVLIDFSSESSEEIFRKVQNAVEGLSIGLLVNNVGLSYPNAMYYDEVPLSLIDDLISVNIRSTLVVTKAVIPGMKARKQGLIVCVGSSSSYIPSDPLYSAYAAAKGSIEAFCRSLKVECSSFGIDVQCHVPLLVTTKLSRCKSPSLMIPSTKTYARAAVAAMSKANTSPSTVSPYWFHKVLLFVAKSMPLSMWNRYRLAECISLRRRALKKREGEKKNM